MSGASFVRMYGNDWFTGVVGLKADERGVLISICIHIWTTGHRVPLDDAEAARRLCLQFNLYQRVRDKLLNLGKITHNGDGYGNVRAEAELSRAKNARSEVGRSLSAERPAPASTWDEGRPEPITDGCLFEGAETTYSESRQEHHQNAEARGTLLGTSAGACQGAPGGACQGDRQNAEQNQRPSIEVRLKTKEIEKEEAAQQAAAVVAAPPKIDLSVLSDRVTAACNGALASQAIAPGLASMATPLMWIEQGCDLERDVIPSLTVAGKKNHGKGIRSWDYFTPIVAEAKAKRLAGLPAVNVEAPRKFKVGRFGQRIEVHA